MSTERMRAATPSFRLASMLLALAASLSMNALAQGFAAMVTPPRFELAGKPGESQRQVIEIMNADAQPAKYRLRTADWTLDANAVVRLSNELAPDSCRPWVAIERREVTVPAGGRYRYRFEIKPPANASGECRFAVVLEGLGATVAAGQNISIPVNGQIAVIVYVTLGDAAPQLSVVRTDVAEREGQRVPLIYVRNTGNAHGRLEGFLEGTDASGKKIDFTPSGLPILPGETREIALNVAGEGESRPTVTFPIAILGNLEWNGKSTPFEARFAP
jgi:P pilus assembly chaperone PapD